MMPPNSVRIYDNEKSSEIIALYTNDNGGTSALLMDWAGHAKKFYTQYPVSNLSKQGNWRRRYYHSLSPQGRRSVRINTEFALYGETS